MDKIGRLKFYFICCLITLNGLFIGYAVGLNSRHVLIVDAKMPKYVKPVAAVIPKAVSGSTSTKTTTTTETKKTDGKGATAAHGPGSSGHAAAGKSAHTGAAKPTGAKRVTSSHPTSAKPTHPSSANHTAATDHGTQSTKKSGDAKSATSKAAPAPSKATN
ncbi:hypothetical protein BH10CYA1_BH10CYA1_35250 [soil metagenome]